MLRNPSAFMVRGSVINLVGLLLVSDTLKIIIDILLSQPKHNKSETKKNNLRQKLCC